MRKNTFILIFILLVGHLKAQYISQIYEYKPAPGQHINTKAWGTPFAAKSLVNSLNGHLSLGACGGYVVFGFATPVENNPDNPFGVDFTLFGNPMTDWAELGVVYVMCDDNANGLPDDVWYELAGSDYFFSSTSHNYSVEYTNPNAAANVPWADSNGQTGFVESNSFHTQPYYPLQDSFPQIPSSLYTLKGTRVESVIEKVGSLYKAYKKPFGYADNHLKGSAPYTLPDNPYTAEKENAGGDPFDISWAVDTLGNYVDLDKIHFVKVQTAVQGQAGWLGELSTELRAGVLVSPNSSITGVEDILVVKPLPKTITQSVFPLEAFVFHKGRKVNNASIDWNINLEGAFVDDEQQLHLPSSTHQAIEITARWSEDASVFAKINTQVATAINNLETQAIKVYPNPAQTYLTIEGKGILELQITNLSGQLIRQWKQALNSPLKIDLESFSPGLYLLRIGTKNGFKVFKINKI